MKLSDNWKKINNWILSYAIDCIISKLSLNRAAGLTHIFICICDHFEPLWAGVSYEVGLKRINKWVERLPEVSGKYKDSSGCFPKYTFFYPIEEYHPEYLRLIADLCHQGYGELEIHLHHDNDTGANLRRSLMDFKETLAFKHNLLSRNKGTGEICYGFIHGNWALDNSRPDGRWCGINNELQILQETGCYADFTMPSAPDSTQTKKINSIYYAVDDPHKPKSHDCGIDARKGRKNNNGLLMVQGPLSINFELSNNRITPKIENGCLADDYPVSLKRSKRWISSAIHVKDQPEYVFLKLYAHGCQEKSMDYLLGSGLDSLFGLFRKYYNDGVDYLTHFVSAREMVNIIKSVEEGSCPEDLNLMKNYKFIKV